jgi:hypothetical protein
MFLSRKDILTINQKGWNIVAPQSYGGTALPRYGPLAVSVPPSWFDQVRAIEFQIS